MILICPACSTKYEVASGSIPPQGRAVKCASCHHSWMARPDMPRSPVPPLHKRTGTIAPKVPAGGYAVAGSGTGFAHPARFSQGSAALAALFDSDEEEMRPEPVGEWKGITPQPASEAIDDVLNMPQIARLLGQQEEQEKVAVAAASRRTSRPKASPGAASAVAANAAAAKVARAAAEPRPGPLRLAARMLAQGISDLGDLAGNGLATLLGQGHSDEDAVATPGDRKVTEWRLEQLRRARRRMTPTKMFGWVALAGAFAAMVYAIAFLRHDLSAYWPQAARAYAAVGLGPEIDPLSISSVNYRYARSPQGPVVELTGFVAHGGEEPLRAPLIRADALGADGTLLTSWAFALEGVSRIMPQSETPFRTRALMPDGAARVRVSLMGAEERADLEQSLPEVITALEGGAGGNAFFMRKTTSGWGSGGEPDPIGASPE